MEPNMDYFMFNSGEKRKIAATQFKKSRATFPNRCDIINFV